MNYPLGSFPRFPHQERLAQERRARAIVNSSITRRRKMIHNLNVEIAFFNWLIKIVSSLKFRNEKGQKKLATIQNKMENLRLKLENGKRVHFKSLGLMFRKIIESSDAFPNLRSLNKNQLANMAENIGVNELDKQ